MLRNLFLVISTLGLACALATVLSRNLVRAGLWLVAFFFCVACLFVLLEAEFLAALQVLVYIGAVSILLMFGIMLTRGVQGTDPTSNPSARLAPGLVAGGVLFLLLSYGISRERGLRTQRSWATTGERPAIEPGTEGPSTPRRDAINNMGKALGVELMSRYVIAFELAGLLLTAALVGAIAVAHREEAFEPSSKGAPASSPAAESASVA